MDRTETSTSPTTTTDRRGDARGWTPIQIAAAVVGAVFLLVGIAGFIPGITTDFDQMEFAGPDSGAELLGVFQVSILHNIVHLAFGVIGIAAAMGLTASRGYLLIGGLIYLALALYGVVVDESSDANFVPVNDADDWLHLGLGAGMILLGAGLWPLSHRTPTTARDARTTPTGRVGR